MPPRTAGTMGVARSSGPETVRVGEPSGRRTARFLLLLCAGLLAEMIVLHPGALFRGEIITSSSLGYGMHPWRGHMPLTARPLQGNPILSDDLVLFTPWDVAAREAVRGGSAPLWNRMSGCGMPLLANNQSAVLAPTHVLRWVWDSPRARTVGLLLKPLLAGIGMFLLLSRWGAEPWGALLGGAAWANAAAITVWLMYPLSETAAWFSWVLLGVSMTLAGSGAAARWGPVALASSLGAMLLAGHLPTAAQLLAAGAVGTLAWLVWNRQARERIWRAAAASVLGVMLALPQILPTGTYLLQSQALLDRSGPSPSAAFHLDPEALWSWLVPRGFGSPERLGYVGPMNFNEATASVGLAPLVIALLAAILARGRLVRSLCILIIVSACLAHGVAPFGWAATHIPVLRWSAGQRWIVLAQWGAAALAGVGCAPVLGDRSRRRNLVIVFVVAAVAVLILAHPSLRRTYPGPLAAQTAREALGAVALLGAVSGALAVASFGARRTGFALLVVLTVVAGAILGWGFNPSIPRAAIPGENGTTRALSAAAGAGRVMPVGWVLRPNTSLLAGIPSVTGYDDLMPVRYNQMLSAGDLGELTRGTVATLSSTYLIRRCSASVLLADRSVTGAGLEPLEGFEGPALWGMKVRDPHPLAAWYPKARRVGSGAEAISTLATGGIDDDAVCLEGAGTESLPAGPGGAFTALAFEWPSPNSVSIESAVAARGWVVLRVGLDSGWRAMLDGAQVKWYPADGMFMAVEVPPGAHRVVFDYRPKGHGVGLVLAAIGGAGILVFAFRPPGRRGGATQGPARREHRTEGAD